MVLCLLALLQDVETHECDSTQGWVLTDFGGGVPKGASVSAGDGRVQLKYRRDTLSPLVHAVSLTEFREIRLRVRSEAEIALVLALQDRDGATFRCVRNVEARKWTDLSAKPADFELNEDSPVKKKALDPRRLGTGCTLLDAGAFLGAEGGNVLSIDRVEIESEAMPRKSGDLVVDGTLEISSSEARDGRLHVKEGGRLKISAPRFVLSGDAEIEGALEIEGGSLTIPQKYNHEKRWTVTGRVSIRGAEVAMGFPLAVELSPGSEFTLQETEVQGGFSCSAAAGAKIRLRKAATPGEFILWEGADLEAVDSHYVILWLPLAEKFRGSLSFPPGARVDDWKGDHVRIRNCTEVLFCIISRAGSDGTIEKTSFYSAGLLFQDDASATLKDLHNGKKVKEFDLFPKDRKVRFRDATVAAWNFYGHDRARVTVERCTFGEALLFGEAKMEIRDSTCDGSGGYVGSEGKSELRLLGCKIGCLVIARDESTLILEDCEVVGDVRAVGSGTVRLIRTKVSGAKESEGSGRILEK